MNLQCSLLATFVYIYIFFEKLLLEVSPKFHNGEIFHFGGWNDMGTEMELTTRLYWRANG